MKLFLSKLYEYFPFKIELYYHQEWNNILSPRREKHVYICVHVYRHICTNMCVHVCICMHRHTYTYDIYVYMCTCVCISIYIHIYNIHVHVCVCIDAYNIRVCTCACVYRHACTYMCVCMCTYVCIDICTHMCVLRLICVLNCFF